MTAEPENNSFALKFKEIHTILLKSNFFETSNNCEKKPSSAKNQGDHSTAECPGLEQNAECPGLEQNAECPGLEQKAECPSLEQSAEPHTSAKRNKFTANYQASRKALKNQRRAEKRRRQVPYSKYQYLLPASNKSTPSISLDQLDPTYPPPAPFCKRLRSPALQPRDFFADIPVALDFLSHVDFNELKAFGRKLRDTEKDPQTRLRTISEHLGVISTIACYSVPAEFSI
ncbi:unnamed protein product [Leptidea sinapis]|uniref:Uncharacterized protein n=1 Tax=Leptidea sinapis TaxID=189913 RepID=A0A5E4R9R0_9NEOP|nr:unnamed protein product [Leptidea sinapis]